MLPRLALCGLDGGLARFLLLGVFILVQELLIGARPTGVTTFLTLLVLTCKSDAIRGYAGQSQRQSEAISALTLVLVVLIVVVVITPLARSTRRPHLIAKIVRRSNHLRPQTGASQR